MIFSCCSKRNLLVRVTAFSCSLGQVDGVSGTARCKLQRHLTSGPQCPDQGHFHPLLQRRALCSLNAWGSAFGPTFVNQQRRSRIDFSL